jgi:hypothetical protein
VRVVPADVQDRDALAALAPDLAACRRRTYPPQMCRLKTPQV